MLICIIASHLSSQIRIDWINECLLSATNYLKPSKIILSYSCENNINFIPPLNDKLFIINHPNKKYQFEHIFECLEYIQDDDQIVLMDDDDLFLPNSGTIVREIFEKYTCSQGCHCLDYLHLANEYNLAKFKDIKHLDFTKLETDIDMPGTLCMGYILRNYFKKEVRHNARTLSLRDDDYTLGEEDCIFTAFYITHQKGYYDNKIQISWLFHRTHMQIRDYNKPD
jgi:hypothetical protein